MTTTISDWLERNDLSVYEKLMYACLRIYDREARAVESSEFGVRKEALVRHVRQDQQGCTALLASLKAKGLIRAYSSLETIDYESYWMIELPYPKEDGSEATA